MFFVPPGGGLFVGLLTPGQPGGLTAVNYRGSGGATPVLDAQPETGAISISDIRTGRGLRLTWPVQDPSFCSENYSILQYDALYERTASLASISGVYSDGDLTIAVNSDGTLTGSDVNSCVFNGSVVVAHANRNYYAATIDVDNCPGSGRFEGIAFLDDSEDLLTNHVLRVIVANPEHALWLWLER